MKKTLLFAGIFAFGISVSAFATDPVWNNTDSNTYPAFTGDYDSNHPYASKKESDGAIRIKQATTKYVDARRTGAQGEVTTLDTRAGTDNTVVTANSQDLSGVTTPTTWAEKGLEYNRQVTTSPATSGECSQNSLGSNYSGCGYIAKSANSISNANNFENYSHSSSSYQWIKIATHCLVDNTLEGCSNHQSNQG